MMYGMSLPAWNSRSLPVEHGRDQHDAVEVHAVAVLEVAGEAGGAGGAVALAGEELGRRPALVAGRSRDG